MMPEEQKPKRKYTRRQPKVEPLAVYAVVVTLRRGKRTETVYAESARAEGGCLVIVSMDGPQPLVERTRYVPLGSCEIDVCRRPAAAASPAMWWSNGTSATPQQFSVVPQVVPVDASRTSGGPRFEPGPLSGRVRVDARPREIVEKNDEGVQVVGVSYLDGSPT